MNRYAVLLAMIMLLFISACTDSTTNEQTCDAGMIDVNGTCVDNITTCNDNQDLIDNQCVDKEITCDDGEILEGDTCIPEEQPFAGTFTMEHASTEREYTIYIPVGTPENAPVVYVLHGYSGTSGLIQFYSGMNDIADEELFAVVYPQGLTYDNATHWNAELEQTTVDDIGFLEALVLEVSSTYSLSQTNVFVTGHSNGGFMSYTLACQSSDTFKAIASYAGLMSNKTWNTCSPQQPISILHIHGTNDSVVPNDGTMSMLGGFGGAPEIFTMLDFWTTYNNTPTATVDVLSEVSTKYSYTSSEHSIRVEYIEIDNFSHMWPFDDQIVPDDDSLNDTSQFIWEFFKQYIE